MVIIYSAYSLEKIYMCVQIQSQDLICQQYNELARLEMATSQWLVTSHLG